MMNLSEIHKPKTIADTVRLVQQSDTVALAGGTELIARQRRDVRAGVDLSALGLSYIRESKDAIAIGATTTLAQVCASSIVRGFAHGVIAQAAQRAATSILRNQGTVAGTLIAEPDSILAAAMLAVDGHATIVREETRTVLLAEILSMREHFLTKALVTEIILPMNNRRATLQVVSRTPRDKPVACVCAAARFEEGVVRDVRIALAGVGEHAVHAKEAEQVLEAQAFRQELIELAAHRTVEGLSPRGDFRASAEYRKAMAQVLTQRTLMQLI